ncbi:MAG: DNA/RNA non-specific endonuclease [Planctomycetaceae bacterium]|nr:DNA/RNA non-specific endonuclease [Planctomycetaceae bacterium]
MFEIPSLRPETRYGIPTADQLLFNREYIVGYSYLLRQAKWAMELIDPSNKAVLVGRNNVFRTDARIPPMFRADLADYKASGHDRGHLISSADRRASTIENSETFLLSNMSPQKGELNQRLWKELEDEVRLLAFDFPEVYAICGPLFDIGKPIEVIGNKMNSDDKNDVVIPIPHAYFKSILAEKADGKLILWSFVMDNEKLEGPTTDYLVPTHDIELRAGLTLWDRLRGEEMEKLKTKKGSAAAFKKAVANGRAAAKVKDETRKKLAQQLGIEELSIATEFLSENPKLADLVLELRKGKSAEESPL